MDCPNCEDAEIIILHTDVIECNDCGATMNIDYCLCPNCQYACRVNNGEFLDEMNMNTDALDEVVEDLEGLLAECGPPTVTWTDESNVGSMLDLLHPCVKCGEAMTAYDPKTFEYECLGCGFKWGILTNE
jgi:ribosomal protein S27E